MILLDEPLSSLDANIKEDLAIEVRSLLKKLNISAIYVTHDPKTANQLSDRIVYINAQILSDE